MAALTRIALEEVAGDADGPVQVVLVRVSGGARSSTGAVVRISERARAGERDGLVSVALFVTVAPAGEVRVGPLEVCAPRELMLRSAGEAPTVHLFVEGLELAPEPLALVNDSGGWALIHLEGSAPLPIAPGSSALLEDSSGRLEALRI